VTLEEAIRLALERSPELAVARSGEGVSRAALEVARTYPYNPEWEVDYRPYTRSSTGESTEELVATSILAEVELGRQGRHRARAGAAEVERTRFKISESEGLVVAETERRFFAALYRRQLQEVEESLAGLKAELRGVVERRFQAGLATSTELALSRLEAGSARQDAALARAKLEAALLAFRSGLAAPPSAALEPAGDLLTLDWLPFGIGPPTEPGAPAAGQPALEAALSARPDLRAAEAASETARARRDLASSSRIPNVKVGPIYEKDEAGTTFVGVITKVPLPVLNSGGPLMRQRQAELEQALSSQNQLSLRSKLEAESALERYRRAQELAARFGAELPGLEAELARVRGQYEAGEATIVQVYTARAGLIQARGRLLDARYELAQAGTELTAVLALPPRAILRLAAVEERKAER
jgi:cobalt-zinc-cadmium efflux system outer membrane protein